MHVSMYIRVYVCMFCMYDLYICIVKYVYIICMRVYECMYVCIVSYVYVYVRTCVVCAHTIFNASGPSKYARIDTYIYSR